MSQFEILLDQDNNIVEKWTIKGILITFVLDPVGHIVYRAVGRREWDDNKFLDVERALRQ